MALAKSQFITSSAQQYLEIFDISNDLLILRDGSASLVLQVNAINFGLLSEPEQDAIIYAYAALINSLSFPIEIVIRSQPKDVTNYLNYLDEQMQKATNPLRKQQIALYRNFVGNLITEQNVLDKNFFVVLPMSALELGLANAANPLSDVIKTNKPPQFDKHYVVEKATNVLIPRRDHMIGQFGRLGLQARHLTTKELIHLFYTSYNMEASEGAKTVDTNEYTSAFITADLAGQNPMAPVAAAPAPAAPPVAPPAAPVIVQPAVAPVAAPSTPAPTPPPPTPAPLTPTPVTLPTEMELTSLTPQSGATVPQEALNLQPR
jgi:hypothetical protein